MSDMCEECKCTVHGDDPCDNGCGCCGDGPNTVVWKSIITKEMVEGWDPNEVELLVADLDDAVLAVYDDFNMETPR